MLSKDIGMKKDTKIIFELFLVSFFRIISSYFKISQFAGFSTVFSSQRIRDRMSLILDSGI